MRSNNNEAHNALKKNTRAIAAFKCILLNSFCVIFIMHEYENNIKTTRELTAAKYKVMYLI